MSTTRIAVFGDTHGHLRLMFQCCRLWQIEHGVPLDGALQCGDLGYFPDTGTLDKATRRFARRDPEELGFSRYFAPPSPEPDPIVAAALRGPPDDLGTLRCDVHFCHGNHEDFRTLRQVAGDRSAAPVDAFARIRFLRSGWVHDVAGLRVGSLGGGPEPRAPSETELGPDAPWQWVGETEAAMLCEARFQILLTHCAPSGLVDGAPALGSARVREVIEVAQPAYCFFSHHQRAVPPGAVGRCACHWLGDVNFEPQEKGMVPFGRVRPGCMGILEWAGPEDHRFGIVEEPWLTRLSWSSWQKPKAPRPGGRRQGQS